MKKQLDLYVSEFKKIIKKSTMGYLIDNIGIKFVDGKVKVSLMSASREGIVVIDTENKIIPDIKGEVDFSFAEPQNNLLPYLDIFDNNKIKAEVYDEKIVMMDKDQKSIVHFCSPKLLVPFNKDKNKIKNSVSNIASFVFDDKTATYFNKIKTIGSKFGKVYFVVDSGSLYLETTDKSIPYTNGLKLKLDGKNVDKIDANICIDYRVFSSINSIITPEENFEFSLLYKNKKGMIYISNDEETYFLTQKYEPNIGSMEKAVLENTK